MQRDPRSLGVALPVWDTERYIAPFRPIPKVQINYHLLQQPLINVVASIDKEERLNYYISNKVIQAPGGDKMRSTITSRGQTVIPAAIRKRFQLSQADGLEWIVEDNSLRVIPVKKNPIEEFRGKGKGGAVARLLADRKKDSEVE